MSRDSPSRTAGTRGTQPPWPRLWPLAALTLAVVVLAAVGMLPTWPGLVHLVALPPLDLFTDVRLLLTQPHSWPVALVWLGVALAVRVALLAVLLGGLTRGNLALAARLYGLWAVPMLLAAFFVTTSATVLYARFFWPAIGFLALVAVLCAALPWQGTTRLRTAWRRSRAGALRVEVVLPYLGVVVVLGVVAHVSGIVLPLVPVSALATALAVRALHRPPARHPRRLALVTGAAVAAGAVVLVGTRVAEDAAPQPVAQEGSILLMSGINSRSGSGAILETEPQRLGYSCAQTFYFSYAGAGDGQPQNDAVCPITTGAPYDADDTQRPVDEQIDAFVAQTDDLPRPLVVAAHSHAVWIAWEALAREVAEVDTLVLVGAFPDSPVAYPPPGENGEGRVLGDLLRLAAPVADLVDFNFDPDAPASHELLAERNVSRQILGQELPEGVRVLSVTSSGDLPLMPGGWRVDAEHNACPVRTAHPNLPLAEVYLDEVIRFLEGEPGRDCPVWRDWGATAVMAFGAVY